MRETQDPQCNHSDANTGGSPRNGEPQLTTYEGRIASAIPERVAYISMGAKQISASDKSLSYLRNFEGIYLLFTCKDLICRYLG